MGGANKGSVCTALLLALDGIDCEHMRVMRRALQVYAENRLDFVDSIFAARSEIESADVLTIGKILQLLLASKILQATPPPPWRAAGARLPTPRAPAT